MDIHLSQHHSLKRLSYPHWMVLLLGKKSNSHVRMGLDSQFYSMGLYDWEFSKFVFHFQCYFGYLEFIVFHINLRIKFSYFCKKSIWTLDNHGTESKDHGFISILTILSLAIYKLEISFSYVLVFSVQMFCFLG